MRSIQIFIGKVVTVYPSDTALVVQYIRNQREHDSQMTFKEEFMRTLKNYNVEYDERYVWD